MCRREEEGKVNEGERGQSGDQNVRKRIKGAGEDQQH